MLFKKPTIIDFIILSVFTILITLHPHFMDGRINIFEVGLYLPGIQGIMDGQIPFRDFFHLRGPFELYIPLMMMKFMGEHLTTLYSYFYIGNVLCLILAILIAKEFFKTRFVLYLFTPVLVARTFPRVVFTFWGGMRQAFGLLVVWCAIKFFKKNKPEWLFAAGVCSVCALFISIEMGVYSLVGVIVALAASWLFKVQDNKSLLKGLGAYVIGCCIIGVPYLVYLIYHSAFIPYIDSTLSVVLNMQKVIDPHLGDMYPRNIIEALVAMTNPNHTNFKHMTPSYLYIAILAYLIIRFRQKKFSVEEVNIVCVAAYGFIMYNTAFRGIWTSHFEIALQLEKILYFFLIELFLFFILDKRKQLISVGASNREKQLWFNKAKVYGIHFLIIAFIGSSLGYSITRYNKRFVAFKMVRDKIGGKDLSQLRPLANEEARVIKSKRAQGILAPIDQANELDEIDAFVSKYVPEGEPLMVYPELGTYNFLFDRPVYGGYPIVTFTWFNDQWHEQFMQTLKTDSPKFIIVEKKLPEYWEKIYFAQESNRKKYSDVINFVKTHYDITHETTLSHIYRLK